MNVLNDLIDSYRNQKFFKSLLMLFLKSLLICFSILLTLVFFEDVFALSFCQNFVFSNLFHCVRQLDCYQSLFKSFEYC